MATREVELEQLAPEVAVDAARRGIATAVMSEGRRVAYVVEARVFEQLLAERELLRRLAIGEMECAAGQGEPLESVIEDCALLVEEC